MNTPERDISHLIDQSIVTSRSERPRHYLQRPLGLRDLQQILQNPQERERYAPIQILKAGLTLITQYNKPGVEIPDEMVAQFGLQNGEKIVQRAGSAQYVFDTVSNILNLPTGHLSIGVTNKYLEVHKGGKARSAIMPTHFRDGAEIFIPHDDYMYDLSPAELPKIHIGENSYFAQNVRLDVGGLLQIGDRVFIARNAHRFGHTHRKDYPGIARETMTATRTDYPILVGDDVLIGYDSDISAATDYIGQNTIIGQKSIITAPWLGDFSIVVGNNKTVGYLPVQAYFKSQYPEHVDTETMAKIDWNGTVKAEWERHYAEQLKTVSTATEGKESTPRGKVLILGDTSTISALVNIIANGSAVDYVANNSHDFAFLLQFAQNSGNMRLRIRQGTDYFIQNNSTMYDYIVDNRQTDGDNDKVSSWVKK